VSETGKVSKTIAVTLNVTPNLTGVAVFKVTRSANPDIVAYANRDPAQAEAWARGGSLTRISPYDAAHPNGIKKIEMLTSSPYLQENNVAGDCLLDALAWIDRNAESNSEYLVRVEKNEELPKIYLTFVSKEYVTLRLRGDGTERVIKHNGTASPGSYANLYWNNRSDAFPSAPPGGVPAMFFGLNSDYETGPSGGATAPYRGHYLYLEKNITFDGLGSVRTHDMYNGTMLSIGYNGRLVMLEGSKITKCYGPGTMAFYPITFTSISGSGTGPDYNTVGRFYMYGGVITDNNNGEYAISGVNGSAVIKFPSKMASTQAADRVIQAVFFKYGGSISNNTGLSGALANKLRFGNGTANDTEIQDGSVQELPVF
jgi:hypothetical protein